MNLLENAREAMALLDGGSSDKDFIKVAQAYAAIAQAEQLKRIADMLERFVNTYGVSEEVVEAANRALEMERK